MSTISLADTVDNNGTTVQNEQIFNITGQCFHTKGSGYRKGYMFGVLDTVFLVTHLNDNEKKVIDFKNCLEGKQSYELQIIIERYIERHRNQMDQNASHIIYEAFKEECN